MAQNIATTSTSQRMIRAHGSLGWALPAAIGAKAAAPDRPVVCFTGDGGFFYHMAELETAMRHGINVIVVVNNNASLNQESFIWEGSDRWDKNWKFSPVSFAGIAEAFGTGFARVEKPGDMAGAFKTALAANTPFVIEAVTDLNAMSVPPYVG
jgi:acetolactate synthase-1/2/3 large subunit